MWLVFQDKANRKALVRQEGIDAFFLHRVRNYCLAVDSFNQDLVKQMKDDLRYTDRPAATRLLATP